MNTRVFVHKKKAYQVETSSMLNEFVEKIVDDMTLFDDDLMSMVFDGNIPATELVLKIILDRKDNHIETPQKNKIKYTRDIKIYLILLFVIGMATSGITLYNEPILKNANINVFLYNSGFEQSLGVTKLVIPAIFSRIKIKKALELQEKGSEIIIIREDDFFAMLEE